MYRVAAFITALLVIAGCSSYRENRIRKNALEIAVSYALGQVDSSSEKEVGPNGSIIIGNEEKRYLVDPSALFIGYIDDDDKPDAIISVVSFEGRYLGPTEHLFIMNLNNKLIMQKAFESDMKIIQLENRIITAEVPEHPRTSPLFNCPECREVVHYKYKMGELIKVE